MLLKFPRKSHEKIHGEIHGLNNDRHTCPGTCRNSGYSPGANETQVLELKTHQTSLVGGFPEKYERLRIIKIGLKSFAVLKSRRK
jgi:hypothetical protein